MPLSFALTIADIPFVVQTPAPDWLETLSERYRPWLAGADAPAPWRVHLEHDPTLAGSDAMWAEHAGPLTRFQVGVSTGWIDLASRRAEVSVGSLERAGSAIDRVLAYVCMQVLPRERRGILLHAVGVEFQGAGLVFCGPSGAGKTTIARLAAGQAQVLTDETLIVSLLPPQPLLVSTPLWGGSTPLDLIQRVNRQVALAALFLLEQAPDFELAPLQTGQAVLALLASEKVAVERVSSANVWLAAAEQLVSRAPTYRLRFKPTGELWPFLAQHLPGRDRLA